MYILDQRRNSQKQTKTQNIHKLPGGSQENRGYATGVTGRGCRGGGLTEEVAVRGELTSLRQRQQYVLHQHGANQHLFAVDRQLGRPFLFGHDGYQHQAAAGHRPAGEP